MCLKIFLFFIVLVFKYLLYIWNLKLNDNIFWRMYKIFKFILKKHYFLNNNV